MLNLKNSISYLIAANVTIFCVGILVSFDLSYYFALFFPENPRFGFWQIFTHLFLHAGVTHLLFNMYGLWAFGTPLQIAWGNQRFLAFYLLTGLGAALIYTLANYYQFSTIYDDIVAHGYNDQLIARFLSAGKIDQDLLTSISEDRLRELYSIYNSPAVGASGAIYGVLVAFAAKNPNARLMLMFVPFPIKAMYFVPLIILGDLFFGITRYSVGNVAHFAHVGGAITGAAIMLWFYLKNKRGVKAGML